MLQKLRKAELLWPTLAALAALAVLIGLGAWQMERKRWKEDLIAKIAARVHADPVPLPAVGGSDTALDLEYLHVLVRGRFHHDKERYLYAPTAAGLGWHIYTPLELVSQPRHIVWINRGFVPDASKPPATRSEGQVQGEVEVRGLVRLPAVPGRFAAQNDPARNLWYWPDLHAMTASAFPAGPQDAPGGAQTPTDLSLRIDADAQPEPPGGLPRGGVTRLQLPNRHLEYALTWYGLAATLVGVYFFFVVSRLRAAT
jgi:surfeit locus 1 family protein